MTTQVAIVPDTDAETRWRNWQARHAKADRRTARRTRVFMVVVAVAVLTWLATQVV